jgi:dTDP-4-dehydrorhamnose 3,5-epimerase
MKVIETGIEGLLIIEPVIHGDSRGYFFESYNESTFEKHGISHNFVQDNEAFSSKYTFRGFHYQLPPFAQTKLVRVISGSVMDIVIDIRPKSATYGEVYSIILSAENKRQFLVPKGFAHGYLCLEDDTIFAYKVDQYYSRDHEKGISYLDENLRIDWPLDINDFITSAKDKLMPPFGSHVVYE